MSVLTAESVTIPVSVEQAVSGLLTVPDHATACYVLAHGAGAGMNHAFMAAVAEGLAARGIATLRYQFPFMEQGSKRPDRPPLAHAAVRAAVAMASERLPALPLFAGGKSFGGRMTSQAQAQTPLPQVDGLIFFGFPLHAAKKPSITRADHLAEVRTPMLFLQGSRDALADMDLLTPIIEGLGQQATLSVIDGADHGFHVPARMGRTDGQVLDQMLDTAAAWIAAMSVARGS